MTDHLLVEPPRVQATIVRQLSPTAEISVASWAWSIEQEVGTGTGDEAGWAGRIAVRDHADDLRRLADA
jgi:hypothetical protein